MHLYLDCLSENIHIPINNIISSNGSIRGGVMQYQFVWFISKTNEEKRKKEIHSII